MSGLPRDPLDDPILSSAERDSAAARIRPVLTAVAQMIATDRRAVALVNRKGRILLANSAAQRLGISREALLERLDWAALCSQTARAGSVAVSWAHEAQSFEGELVLVPLGTAGKGARGGGEGGALQGYLLRLSESDQEATWLRNRARAAALMRVAHDLRTPIQSLLASADALIRDTSGGAAGPGSAGPEPQTATQSAIQAGTQAEPDAASPLAMRRAAALALDHIGNVLAVIRGDQAAGGAQADEAFRLTEEVAALVEMVAPIAAARATEVTLQSDVPEGLVLHGPLRFVRALCQNLIDNSVNHGGGRVAVRLQAAPLAGDPAAGDAAPGTALYLVRLELRDEGGGLPEAAKQRLTEALGTARDGAAGVTLQGNRPSAGMSVLAHALRQLGGRMVISDLGSDGAVIAPPGEGQGEGQRGRVVGTLFEVSFSLPGEIRIPAQPAKPAPAASGPGLLGRHILLVEDSPSSRDWLAHLLRAQGAGVTLAGSGPEALALMQRASLSRPVDLVLSDVTLPRMSGIEFTMVLRSGNGAAAQPWAGPVVGLTAHVDEHIRAACLRAGMTVVLEKPVQPARLCATLAGILQGSLTAAAAGTGAETGAEPGARTAAAKAPRSRISAPKPSAGKSPMPPPPADGAAAPDPIAPDPIAPRTLADMTEHMGAAAALAFITRAMEEAQTVHDELQREGPGPDTGRRLHAATGAAGLTGLVGIERQLRALEAATAMGKGTAAGQAEMAGVLAALGEALAEARGFARILAASGAEAKAGAKAGAGG